MLQKSAQHHTPQQPDPKIDPDERAITFPSGRIKIPKNLSMCISGYVLAAQLEDDWDTTPQVRIKDGIYVEYEDE